MCRVKVLIDTKVKGEVVVDVVVKLDVKKGDVDVVVVDKYTKHISSFLMLFIATVKIHSKLQ